MQNFVEASGVRPAPSVTSVMLEIVKGALSSAQAEMERLLQRTAMSPIIREKQDYFCGLFDRQGRLLMETKLPLLGNILDPVLEFFPMSEMKPGNVYRYDDPYLSREGCPIRRIRFLSAPSLLRNNWSALPIHGRISWTLAAPIQVNHAGCDRNLP